eukprot:TRINITY_DN7467_c0_g1_i1.p6 TRINITY_DN7467_c0_g1~~TRINITY_DN7467_c0_g1_i1.p6  ORF type:complete len:280 (-),score=42.90 TRINITY_DN7467_c0_g1_i1:945-1784(-)
MSYYKSHSKKQFKFQIQFKIQIKNCNNKKNVIKYNQINIIKMYKKQIHMIIYNESRQIMKRLIMIFFMIILSLTMVSCDNIVNEFLNKENKENKEQIKSTRKKIDVYFISTSEKEKNNANWVKGEINQNPLIIEEKNEEKKEKAFASKNEKTNKSVESTKREVTPQKNTQTNSFIPDSSYDMNDIIPGPDEASSPQDISANSNDIIADPYDTSNNEEQNSSKMAENKYLGETPQQKILIIQYQLNKINLSFENIQIYGIIIILYFKIQIGLGAFYDQYQ